MKNNNAPAVSIIVPVYMVEEYLERCVNSVLSQSLSDIEVILVNDGSPDNSPKICEEYKKVDSRVKVVHKLNGGLSSARNAGLNAAEGKYIGYVDSDDYIDIDMYEKLYLCAEKHCVDFVMCDYKRIFSSGESRDVSFDIREGLYTRQDIIDEIYPNLIMRESMNFGPLLSVWHCLYNREFVVNNGLYFDDDIPYSEDCIYSAVLGYKANSFYYLKGCHMYNYMCNANSITTSYKPDAWDIYCKMNDKLRQFFTGISDYDFSRQLDLHIFYYALYDMGGLSKQCFSFKEEYVKRKTILNDHRLRRAFRNGKIPDVGIMFYVHFIMIKYRMNILLIVKDRLMQLVKSRLYVTK